MKSCQALILFVVLLVNLIFLPPAWADRPNYRQNPDYLQVTKTIEAMTKTQANGNLSEQDLETLANLEFLKYSLETGTNWGQCTNKTSKNLLVYGKDPEAEEEDKVSSYANEVYFLAPGETTASQWDCEGFYLPNDLKASKVDDQGNPQEINGPNAIKILDGTQLVVEANPVTKQLEFQTPLTEIVEAKQENWYIPNISQAFIDTRVANAPTN